MHGRPHHPCEKAAEPHAPALQHGKPLADHRQVPLVEVTEWWRGGLTADASSNQPAGIASLLHRDLRHAGQRMTILLERRGVTHHEDLRVAWHGEIRLHADAA